MPRAAKPDSPVRPTIVIDTSSLVNDPTTFLQYPDHDAVIPLVVVEELDQHKTRPDEVGRAAREVIRTLERLRTDAGGTLAAPTPLPNGGTLRIELNGVHTQRLTDVGLDTTTADNRLLGVAIGLSTENAPVTVISADAAVRLKAGQLGLQAHDHIAVRRADVVGEKIPGWATVEVDGELLTRLHSERHLPMDEVVTLAPHLTGLAANTGLVLKAGTASALARTVDGPASPTGRPHLIRLTGDISAWGMRAKNKEQRFALELLLDPDVTVVGLSGPGGTGKTFACVAAALEQVFEPASAIYDRLMIIRPLTAVGRQEIGFLPGDMADKIGPHYEAIVDTLVALGDQVTHRQARDIIDGWRAREQLVLEPVTFLRGRSLKRHFIIVDEAQNLSPEVLKTILTRVGEGSKVVFTGDVTQQDVPYLSDTSNALSVLVDRFHGEDFFGHVHLTAGLRSRIAERAAELL